MNLATDATAAEFNAAYLKAQPAAVQALMASPQPRMQQAIELALAGYLIDGTIMVWGWDSYQTTKARTEFGYTWVPSYMQPPVQIAPGLSQGASGPPTYDGSIVPHGAILVTLDMDALPGLFPAPPKG